MASVFYRYHGDITKPILSAWNKQTETKAILRRMTSQDDTIVNSHLVGLMVMEKSSCLPLLVGRTDVLDDAYRGIFIIIYAVISIFFGRF